MRIPQATDACSPDHIAASLSAVVCLLMRDLHVPPSDRSNDTSVLLFAEAMQRKPSHMDELQSERGSQAQGGPTGRQVLLNFSSSSSPEPRRYISHIRIVVASAAATTPTLAKHALDTLLTHSWPLLISQHTGEETSQRTHPSCSVCGLLLQYLLQLELYYWILSIE